MARSFSVDLRRRVVDAIEGGLSCRAAAQRFGVSGSSAIRWRAMERRDGDVTTKRQGGDRHSHPIEAHAELILFAVAAKSDITLSELQDGLRERGVAVATGTAPWALENHHLHRRAALRRHCCAHGPRRPDERRGLSRLCRTGARSRVAATRHRHHGQSARPQGPWRQTGDRGRCASLRYLPPYSPDFNPIEMAFAKLKAALRAAAARTIPDLWQAIADALRRFTPQECANYLAAAGYDAT
jgi:transposase